MAPTWTVYPPFTFIVAQKCSKLWGVGMLKEHDEEILVEFERTRELTKYLPHTVQEEEKHRCLPLLLAVAVGWLCAALLEWVTSLRGKVERWLSYPSEATLRHVIISFTQLQQNCYTEHPMIWVTDRQPSTEGKDTISKYQADQKVWKNSKFLAIPELNKATQLAIRAVVVLGISNRIMDFCNNKHNINLTRLVKSGAKSKNVKFCRYKTKVSSPLLSSQSAVAWSKLHTPHHYIKINTGFS